MDEKKAPLLSHLAELRTCLMRAIIGVVIAMVFAYIFVGSIMDFLKKPILDAMPNTASLVVLAPQEYFFTELKAALFFGILLACPWIFWQIWRFISPGLYKHEQRMLTGFIFSASVCFLLGVLFAYFLVLPPAFQFFIDTLPKDIVGAYSISMLYGFAITVLLAFGIVFQTPIAVFLLISFGLVSLKSIAGYRRIVFVMCFVVGAILTPPDPITQVMLAIPMYILFELGLFFAKVVQKKSEL